MRLSDEVRDVVRRHGLIVRREHPGLVRAIKTLVTKGELVPVLPGVYVSATVERDVRCRVAAASAWDPELVFIDATAAWLTFWSDLSVPVVDGAVPRERRPQVGYRFSRRTIPAELSSQVVGSGSPIRP